MRLSIASRLEDFETLILESSTQLDLDSSWSRGWQSSSECQFLSWIKLSRGLPGVSRCSRREGRYFYYVISLQIWFKNRFGCLC